MNEKWDEMGYEERPRAAWHLSVDVEGNKRYLVNTSKVGVERIVYSTVAISFYDDDMVVSSRPSFELLDLPSGAKVFLEDVDPYEDGMISFRTEAVDWADGVREEGEPLVRRLDLFNFLATKRRKDLIEVVKEASVQDFFLLEREARKVGEVEGHVVRGTSSEP